MSSAYTWPSFQRVAAVDFEAERAAAARQGHAQGYAEGLAQARRETEALQQQLGASLRNVEQALVSYGDEQARALTELALRVTTRLLQAELRCNPAVLFAMVSRALEVLNTSANEIQVLAHPDDLPWVRASLLRAAEPAAPVDLDPAPEPTAERRDDQVPARLHPDQVRADPGLKRGCVSVVFGSRCVEFDPLGEFEQFVEQEVDGGADSQPAG